MGGKGSDRASAPLARGGGARRLTNARRGTADRTRQPDRSRRRLAQLPILVMAASDGGRSACMKAPGSLVEGMAKAVCFITRCMDETFWRDRHRWLERMMVEGTPYRDVEPAVIHLAPAAGNMS